MLQYPVYIPSKGRWKRKYCTTPAMLESEGIAYKIMVEPQDYDRYAQTFGKDCLIRLQDNDRGCSFVRNAIKQEAANIGASYFWSIDDDMKRLVLNKTTERSGGKAHTASTLEAMNRLEEIVELYQNIAITAFAHKAFGSRDPQLYKFNRPCYGYYLARTDLPFYWREDSGVEDIDYNLQVLSSGWWVTLQCNEYTFDTPATTTNPGGTTGFYEADSDYRAKIVRKLQSKWPLIVKITRRNGLPRVSYGQIWSKFQNQPIPR